MLNYVVKFVGAENSSCVDKQVELQVTHNESESQLQGGENQHTTVKTTISDVHPEARQTSITIDRGMAEEMESLWKNLTWELVKRPKERKIVTCKWIFIKKEGTTPDEGVRYKARLVARGFT
ncbi:hypothetical protein AAHA92_01343 [Salvia divinorum]|uniref:Reverse transcriptase Ty1/copia-type domain-containing protein n=1 Tax=Salvia divinorum TaxID=28513 RepID=A0ABD1IN70_SALDI